MLRLSALVNFYAGFDFEELENVFEYFGAVLFIEKFMTHVGI